MKRKGYLSVPELAKILSLSKSAVYKKIAKGQIKAIRYGRILAIPKDQIQILTGETLSPENKKEIEFAVRKVVNEYGEVLRLLGQQ